MTWVELVDVCKCREEATTKNSLSGWPGVKRSHRRCGSHGSTTREDKRSDVTADCKAGPEIWLIQKSFMIYEKQMQREGLERMHYRLCGHDEDYAGLCNTPLLFPLTQAFNNSIVKRCYQKVSNLVSNISYKPLCASMLQDGRSPWMQYPGIQRRSKPYATLLGCYTERLHLLSKHQDPLLSSATSGPNYLFFCKTLLAPL